MVTIPHHRILDTTTPAARWHRARIRVSVPQPNQPPRESPPMIVKQIWTGNADRNLNYPIACPVTGEAPAVGWGARA